MTGSADADQPAVDAMRGREREFARQLERLGSLLRERERDHQVVLGRLATARAKLMRDGLAGGLGMILSPPTGGLSLLLSFWASCSLLVDGLDLSDDIAIESALRRAIEGDRLEIAAVAKRLAEIQVILDR